MLNLEKVGSRVYIGGNTYPYKSELKTAGCHWDGDRKQWWVGSTKADAISDLIKELNGAPPPVEDVTKLRVYAKVNYKSRTYYVIGDTGERCRLAPFNGSINFWVDKSTCELLKEYQPRNYRGQTEYTTLASLQAFLARKQREDELLEQGVTPEGWCMDMEDGCIKPRWECDMPEN